MSPNNSTNCFPLSFQTGLLLSEAHPYHGCWPPYLTLITVQASESYTALQPLFQNTFFFLLFICVQAPLSKATALSSRCWWWEQAEVGRRGLERGTHHNFEDRVSMRLECRAKPQKGRRNKSKRQKWILEMKRCMKSRQKTLQFTCPALATE